MFIVSYFHMHVQYFMVLVVFPYLLFPIFLLLSFEWVYANNSYYSTRILMHLTCLMICFTKLKVDESKRNSKDETKEQKRLHVAKMICGKIDMHLYSRGYAISSGSYWRELSNWFYLLLPEH